MRIAIPAAMSLALFACGQNSSDNSSSLASVRDAASRLNDPGEAGIGAGRSNNGGGTAEAGNVDCGVANAISGDGPDVIGVTIGMPAEAAFQKVACSNPALRVEYSESGGFPVPPLPDGSRPRGIIIGNGGGEKIQVWLAGMPARSGWPPFAAKSGSRPESSRCETS